MIGLDVLAVGYLVRDADGELLEAHSTSTLIRTGDSSIVVDTSSRFMRPALKSSFRDLGVYPKDVDTVVLTHSHQDHTGNLDLFPNAEVYVQAGGDDLGADVNVIEGDMQLCSGVRLVRTPGHTPDSMSVFVEADRAYVVAGDAVPTEDNYRKMVPPRICADREAAMEIINSIANFADIIVPGHGFPFMTR